jgi:serine/threonine-protein kinase
MAKVFTITEGIENLGALKSGGQGSVYKAKKTGEIITAIKILPTPISSETDDDKNFTSFQNEVQKLKKVNETPNPNVVSIINSGITASGNLPYIEMEYIEGPDLGELLKPPYDPVFTIKETIKVADQLCNALAHCHRSDVKHGDIKSNNVKFNQRTGNYILLDFGLSIMSDEQRRTSIRHAGAIEFMAPEQNTGEMLFETDIYSFGIILFELLSGTVPFPLDDRGGSIARNTVMLAHMESLPPDLISLRRMAMPESWTYEKQEREMQVPGWLVNMIYQCLEKEPAKRFKDGADLQEFIHTGIIAEENRRASGHLPAQITAGETEPELQQKIQNLEQQVANKDYLIEDLQVTVELRDKALYQYRYSEEYARSKSTGVSKGSFAFVLIIALGLAGFNAYTTFIKPTIKIDADTAAQINERANSLVDSAVIPVKKPVKKPRSRVKKSTTTPVKNNRSGQADRSKYEAGKDSIQAKAGGK